MSVDRKLRVLQVLTDDDLRGAQVFGWTLGGRLRELGVDVRTVALTAGDTGGLDLEVLGPSRRHPRTLAALRRAMGQADVTAAHGSTTLAACALASFGPGRPFVYRQISDPAFWTPTVPKRLRTRWFYRSPARVVALSSLTAAILQERFRVPRERIDIVPNAVDERRFLAASERQGAEARARLRLPPRPHHVIAYVGALVPEKGVTDLIDAADPGAHLVIAGDGAERGSLARRAADRGIAATFLGAIEDPWDVYAAADVLALPSRGGDTQPAVLIEAALVGTPTVSTTVGAIEDIIVDGETGVLVAPSDVGALRRALADLASRPERARQLAEHASARARAHFSMSVVASRWADTLARAAG